MLLIRSILIMALYYLFFLVLLLLLLTDRHHTYQVPFSHQQPYEDWTHRLCNTFRCWNFSTAPGYCRLTGKNQK